jgi:hypothetical protein
MIQHINVSLIVQRAGASRSGLLARLPAVRAGLAVAGVSDVREQDSLLRCAIAARLIAVKCVEGEPIGYLTVK